MVSVSWTRRLASHLPNAPGARVLPRPRWDKSTITDTLNFCEWRIFIAAQIASNLATWEIAKELPESDEKSTTDVIVLLMVPIEQDTLRSLAYGWEYSGIKG